MRRIAVALLLVAALAAAFPTHARLQTGAPSVRVVDPPNWFVGHSLGEIQLLVRGRDLDGSTLVSATAGVEVRDQRVTGGGDYVIAHLRIGADAHAGPVELALLKGGASTPVPFSLAEKLPAAGRFQGFGPDDVIYLLMPDRFADGDASNDNPDVSRGQYDRGKPFFYHGGDFAGVRAHLPYLKDLGVTAIWLNPIYDNSNAAGDFPPYHGYSAIDYYGVEEHFGTLEEFRALVDDAHAVGIKVIQDEVANHTAPDHPWVSSYPTPTWYNGTPAAHLNNVYDIASIVDPRADPARRRATLEGWFGDFLPDLDQNDDDTAQYEIQNTLWWIDQTGIDGIRQDTLPYVPRTFWNRWETAIKAEHPSFTVVGEVFDGSAFDVSFFQGGVARWDGIDSRVDTVFDFPLAFQIDGVFAQGRDVGGIATLLEADSLYPRPGALVPFIGNHDIARFLTRAGGNVKRLMLANLFLLTTRGTPQLYYGDEIAMQGGNDPDNRRDFPGGFPGDAQNAFDAAGRSKKQAKVHDFVKKLVGLRAALPGLRDASTTFLKAEGSILAYVRGTGDDRVLVVINAGETTASVKLDLSDYATDGTVLHDLVGSSDFTVSNGVGKGKVRQLQGVVSLIK